MPQRRYFKLGLIACVSAVLTEFSRSSQAGIETTGLTLYEF